MLIFLFLFLPAALTIVADPLPRGSNAMSTTIRTDWPALGEGTIWFEEYWTRFSSWIIRHHAAVAVGLLRVHCSIGLGLTRVHTNIDLLKLFDESVRVRQDYAWLEEHIGRLVPLEVVVEFPADKRRGGRRASRRRRSGAQVVVPRAAASSCR